MGNWWEQAGGVAAIVTVIVTIFNIPSTIISIFQARKSAKAADRAAQILDKINTANSYVLHSKIIEVMSCIKKYRSGNTQGAEHDQDIQKLIDLDGIVAEHETAFNNPNGDNPAKTLRNALDQIITNFRNASNTHERNTAMVPAYQQLATFLTVVSAQKKANLEG